MCLETHTFSDVYTCPQWLTTFGCESISVTDKVNVQETNTVWAQSYKTTAEGQSITQRDALPWTDVTLSTVRGFDPGRGRWIKSIRKNPAYDFLRKGSKTVGPVS